MAGFVYRINAPHAMKIAGHWTLCHPGKDFEIEIRITRERDASDRETWVIEQAEMRGARAPFALNSYDSIEPAQEDLAGIYEHLKSQGWEVAGSEGLACSVRLFAPKQTPGSICAEWRFTHANDDGTMVLVISDGWLVGPSMRGSLYRLDSANDGPEEEDMEFFTNDRVEAVKCLRVQAAYLRRNGWKIANTNAATNQFELYPMLPIANWKGVYGSLSPALL